MITVTILSQGKLIISTIDTGVTRNFVKTGFIGKLTKNPQFAQERTEFVLADDTKTFTENAIAFLVTFGNKTEKCTFLIMPEFSEDIILVLEFLTKFSPTLSCAGITLQWYSWRKKS